MLTHGIAEPGPDAVLLGSGESAEVFAFGANRALKLLRPHVPPRLAETEFVAAGAAHAAGLWVAQPFALVEVAGRAGIVLQRLAGPMLLRKVGRRPVGMTVALARLACWQARLHRIGQPGLELPALHDVLAARIERSHAGGPAIAAARAALARLADDTRLCHGDLHMGNVVATPEGLAVIDWMKATLGAAEADAARSELLIRYAGYGRAMRRHAMLRIMRHISAEFFLACYCLAARRRRRTVLAWRLPVAVAWLQGQETMYEPGVRRAIARMVRAASLADGTPPVSR